MVEGVTPGNMTEGFQCAGLVAYRLLNQPPADPPLGRADMRPAAGHSRAS